MRCRTRRIVTVEAVRKVRRAGERAIGDAARHVEVLPGAVDDLGQTIVMVTHDPTAASYADRVVFLTDGQITCELRSPTAEQVLDQMKSMGA